MATFNLRATDVFPEGTSIGAYPASGWHVTDTPPSGAAQGAATESQTMTGGVASFASLAADTQYYFGAQVSGTWRYVAGRTSPVVAATETSLLAQSYRSVLGVKDLQLASATATGTYLNVAGVPTAVAGAASSRALLSLDPADLTAQAGLAKKIRLRGRVITNAVAPGASVTFQLVLLPVATIGGASAAAPTVATVGAAAVSSNTITAPAASSSVALDSGDVAHPAAGDYCLAVVVGGAAVAANALQTVTFQLDRRNA